MNPPQEIVGQFLGSRLLERRHSTALGVHRAQEMVNRPVLAPRVHPLQADQEGAPSIRVEQLLQLAQLFPVLLNLLGRFLVALVVVLEPRIDVLELDFAAGRHSEPIDIFHLDPPTMHATRRAFETTSISAVRVGSFGGLAMPSLSLRLKPVLICLALTLDSLLVEFIGPCGDLRRQIGRRLALWLQA